MKCSRYCKSLLLLIALFFFAICSLAILDFLGDSKLPLLPKEMKPEAVAEDDSPKGTSRPTNSAVQSPKHEEIISTEPSYLKLVDYISKEPICCVFLFAKKEDTVREIGKSDSLGLVRQESEFQESQEYFLKRSRDSTTPPVKCSLVSQSPLSATKELTFPFYSEILVDFEQTTAQEIEQNSLPVDVWLVSWPHPESLATMESGIDLTKAARIGPLFKSKYWPNPGIGHEPNPSYHSNAARNDVGRPDLLLVSKCRVTEQGQFRGLIPYTGDIFVDCYVQTYNRFRFPLWISQGVSVNVTAYPSRPIRIRGRVVDELGNAVAGAVVGLGSIRRTKESNIGESGVSVSLTPTGSRTKQQLSMAQVKTKTDGRFEATLASDGEIHVFVVANGHETIQKQLPKESTEARDWRKDPLILSVVKKKPHALSLILKSTVPLTQTDLWIGEAAPASMHQIQYPGFRTDERGFVALDALIPGRRYLVVKPPLKTLGGDGSFEYQPGMKISLFDR